jgi:hypothetical protein
MSGTFHGQHIPEVSDDGDCVFSPAECVSSIRNVIALGFAHLRNIAGPTSHYVEIVERNLGQVSINNPGVVQRHQASIDELMACDLSSATGNTRESTDVTNLDIEKMSSATFQLDQSLVYAHSYRRLRVPPRDAQNPSSVILVDDLVGIAYREEQSWEFATVNDIVEQGVDGGTTFWGDSRSWTSESYFLRR